MVRLPQRRHEHPAAAAQEHLGKASTLGVAARITRIVDADVERPLRIRHPGRAMLAAEVTVTSPRVKLVPGVSELHRHSNTAAVTPTGQWRR